MQLRRALQNLANAAPALRDAVVKPNLAVLRSLLGPAFRGLVEQRGKAAPTTRMPLGYEAHFDWTYQRAFPEMRRLYDAAKTSQWNAATDLDWSIDVDPHDPERALLPDSFLPVSDIPSWHRLSTREKNEQRHALLAWMLSQFLHGEQGALFAASQVTEAVPWLDGKLFGSTQVVDEGRHVEVFHQYLDGKLGKLYQINDNLYVIVDALMTDARWDVKFLGMQIMIEGLALGAFGTIRKVTREPLLRELLKYVITDEARHVHYGVLALRKHYVEDHGYSPEVEDWAFETSVLMRNRFLAHEFYDEYYAHRMSRRAWDQLVAGSKLMATFRSTMFQRIIPNLRRIGLLTDRIRPHYAQVGLLEHEHGKAAPEVTTAELIGEAP